MWTRLFGFAFAAAATTAVPALAQGDFWTQTHKFSPEPADYPMVLELAGGPDGALLAGLLLTPGGLQRSSDRGESWTPLGLDHPHVEGIATAADGTIYVGAYGAGVRRSDDGGATWTPSTLPTALVWAVVLDVEGGVLAGTLDGGLYRSTDRGDSWEPISPPWDVRAAVALPGGSVVAALQGGGERWSGDGGSTWTEVSVPGTVFDLATAPGGLAFAIGSSGVSRSADGGVTWALVRPGAGGVLAVNADGIVFAGVGGVARTSDGGATWEDVSAGLTTEGVTALTLDQEGYLYAGTSHGRVFRSSATTTAAESAPPPTTARLLFPAHPNPFASATRVAFMLPQAERLDLAVYDVLGRRIGTLAEGDYPAGRHEVEWAPAELTSGLFHIRLRTNSGVTQSVGVVRQRR